MNGQKIIKDIMACPDCHSDMIWLQGGIECAKCNAKFSVKDGIPDFVGYDIETNEESRFQSEQMFGNTFTGKLQERDKRYREERLKLTNSKVFITAMRAADFFLNITNLGDEIYFLCQKGGDD
jgi:uncharacterized protein YbaR (Trm112 family)